MEKLSKSLSNQQKVENYTLINRLNQGKNLAPRRGLEPRT
jgi:hypothetical protein